MISDNIFTIYRYEIKVEELNQPIYLIPFGDLHKDAPLFDKKKWIEFLEWAETKKNAYFVGMGDYQDFLSTSERRELTEASLHESTYATIEEMMDSHTKQLCREISFMKNRIIGLIEGNHYGQYQTGMTTTQQMCQLLECKYLGVSSFIRLSFKYCDTRYAIDLWCHHGKGAGRTIGSGLNTIQQMSEISDAQCLLMGHTHKKSVAIKTRLCLTGNGDKLNLSHRKILMACTGSFLKGYVDNQPSYIVRGAMAPTDMGVVKIEFTPKRDKDKRFYMDLHCSL